MLIDDNDHKHSSLCCQYICWIVSTEVIVLIIIVELQDEAFALWREQWGRLYDDKSQSYQVIQRIIDNYCLVNLVDNDFPKDTCLFEIIHKTIQLRQHSSNGCGWLIWEFTAALPLSNVKFIFVSHYSLCFPFLRGLHRLHVQWYCRSQAVVI